MSTNQKLISLHRSMNKETYLNKKLIKIKSKSDDNQRIVKMENDVFL